MIRPVPRSVLLCALALLVTGCGGRVPVETIVHQVGDEEKTCDDLRVELEYIEAKAEELMEESDHTLRNLGLLALSTEEPLSILFTDLSLAEKRELTALRNRYNHLVRLALAKECGPPPPPAEGPPPDLYEQIHGAAPAAAP